MEENNVRIVIKVDTKDLFTYPAKASLDCVGSKNNFSIERRMAFAEWLLNNVIDLTDLVKSQNLLLGSEFVNDFLWRCAKKKEFPVVCLDNKVYFYPYFGEKEIPSILYFFENISIYSVGTVDINKLWTILRGKDNREFVKYLEISEYNYVSTLDRF